MAEYEKTRREKEKREKERERREEERKRDEAERKEVQPTHPHTHLNTPIRSLYLICMEM